VPWKEEKSDAADDFPVLAGECEVAFRWLFEL